MSAQDVLSMGTLSTDADKQQVASSVSIEIPRTVAIDPLAKPPDPLTKPAPAPPSSSTGTSTKHKKTVSRGHVKNRLSKIPPAIPAVEPNQDYPDRIRLGICALDKKARSKPMAEILSRLDPTLFQVVFFGDDLILNKPVEEWPICEVLIAYYSTGYPLDKAKAYAALRKPFVVNDLEMQEGLKDRRVVYDLLEASGIDVPRHVFLSLDDYVSTGTGDGNKARETEVHEFDDHIEVNGVSIEKPFVEKPIDANRHDIAIYYPSSAGGGCKKLFRKVGNKSSEFYPNINEVRRDGSYIYEEFVSTQGTDVKMYSVGPEYGHAEARKSPTVDGKVQRDENGKEIRFPVILSLTEKEIARRIVLGFKQFVCGFDLLRVQEGHSVVSYVCDVNGWSHVKNSRKYYDDCAQILTEHVLASIRPEKNLGFSTLDPLLTEVKEVAVSGWPLLKRFASDKHTETAKKETMSRASRFSDGASVGSVQTAATKLEEGAVPVREFAGDQVSVGPASSLCTSNSTEDLMRLTKNNKQTEQQSATGFHKEELRCIITVVRHGDRTPKQKLKVKISEPLIMEYFHKYSKDPTKDLKVKDKAAMIHFLETIKSILTEAKQQDDTLHDKETVYKLRHMRDILERWKISGLNRKLQMKPRKWKELENGKQACTELQLILKWGGNLTKLGETQAIRLGQRFRQEMYPDAPGGGILRLHSTFRHDLKIKTSDEGRVMKTAAAFAKGMLELEGEIPPILVSLVHKEKGSMHMLDPSGDKEVKMELDEYKKRITENLQQDINYREMSDEERERMVGPPELTSLHDALASIGNPRKQLREIHKTMGHLIEELEEMQGVIESGDEVKDGDGVEDETDLVLSGVRLYRGETLLELIERWRFIYDRLYDADNDKFDLSRVPDVHDNVRFDVLHNIHIGLRSTLEKLYELAKSMADCVVKQEYGTTIAQKRSVGVKICSSLLEKIRMDLHIARTDNQADMRYMINMDYSNDLPINSMGRRVRTRLYFTSESHLHTLLNVLRFAGDGKTVLSEPGLSFINQTPELCYLTQVSFRLFEDTSLPMEEARRFRVEIFFSPGATAPPIQLNESEKNYDTTRLDTAELVRVEKDGLTCEEIEEFFEAVICENDKHHGCDKTDVISHSTPPSPMWKKLYKKHDHSSDQKSAESSLTEKTEEVAKKSKEVEIVEPKKENGEDEVSKDSEDAVPSSTEPSNDFLTKAAVGLPIVLGVGYCLANMLLTGDHPMR